MPAAKLILSVPSRCLGYSDLISSEPRYGCGKILFSLRPEPELDLGRKRLTKPHPGLYAWWALTLWATEVVAYLRETYFKHPKIWAV